MKFISRTTGTVGDSVFQYVQEHRECWGLRGPYDINIPENILDCTVRIILFLQGCHQESVATVFSLYEISYLYRSGAGHLLQHSTMILCHAHRKSRCMRASMRSKINEDLHMRCSVRRVVVLHACTTPGPYHRGVVVMRKACT